MKLAALPLAVALAACAAPQVEPPRTPDVNRWHAWVAENVHAVEVDLSALGYAPGTIGGYDIRTDVLAVDPQAIHAFVGADAKATTFLRTHEAAHVADWKVLHLIQGRTAVGVERGAQCIAEAVLGYSFTSYRLSTDAFWDCPDQEVKRATEALMKEGLL